MKNSHFISKSWCKTTITHLPVHIFPGSGDAVKCFYCGGIIRSWEEADIPWEEHKRWFPSCPFIIENSFACQEELQKRSQTKSICVIAKENGYSEDLLNFHKNYGEENGCKDSISYSFFTS